ncbi:hypothetical protein IRP63_05275 [Clostridium botulinum]|uniref:hypothetical protein n=1 Tax=Clostridium TaxID=1485 RepID=UPI000A57DD84|nr:MULTISPECIES: hypothetical protein [Clostridium]MCD3234588.1 hypothetical protein [Clostridium botulinum D/C]MCD3239731.1 hypothetical protein [Clostridium botulinum D/C]MCD3267993.1 hypothetical protein [Clostridium botulinum D/C]MCD3299072.1 hypothetical protein [Clostridium botulinum D/C]MCD3305556.1 hypothetical protein [Clostridium botulinum D/C]
MSERQEEVNFAVNLIQKLCEEYNIALIAKDHKGTEYVAIHDHIEDKDYVIMKDK